MPQDLMIAHLQVDPNRAEKIIDQLCAEKMIVCKDGALEILVS
jgi:hypothetical protein